MQSIKLYLLGDDLKYNLIYIIGKQYAFDATTLRRLSIDSILYDANRQYERVYGTKSNNYIDLLGLINNPLPHIWTGIPLNHRFDDHQLILVKFTFGHILLALDHHLSYVQAYGLPSTGQKFINSTLIQYPDLSEISDILPAKPVLKYDTLVLDKLVDLVNGKNSLITLGKLLSGDNKRQFTKFIDNVVNRYHSNVNRLYNLSHDNLLRHIYKLSGPYTVIIDGIISELPNPSTVPQGIIIGTGPTINIGYQVAVGKIARGEIVSWNVPPVLQPWAGDPSKISNRLVLLHDANGLQFLVTARLDDVNNQLLPPIES